MRELKKHWRKKRRGGWSFGELSTWVPLCGSDSGVFLPKYASKKSAVTCRNCARILAGYQGEKK